MRTRWIGAARVALRGLLAIATLVGCSDDSRADGPSSGGSTATTTPPRPITSDEASRLADILLNNYEAGGADLRAVVPFGVATVTLTGSIDWKNHVGRVRLHSEVTGAAQKPDFDIVWTKTTVAQQLEGLADALVAAGRPAATWVGVPLDPSSSPLHVVLSLIDSAASIQRDNPILLLSRGITFVRSDRVDGTDVDVFDLGRTTYWVSSDAVLHRIDAELSSTGSTAEVTFTAPGPRALDLPADVVDAADIPDIYARLNG